MTVSGESWRTPAGVALAQASVGSASQGRPVFLHARRAGAKAQLQEAIHLFGCDPLLIDPAEDIAPLSCIAGGAGLGDRIAASGNLLSLISDPALRDVIVCADVSNINPAAWSSFAGVFATARRSFHDRAAGLIVISNVRLQAPTGCEAWSDDAIVDVIDAMAAIRNWSGWPLTLVNEVAMATAVEVTRGDLDQLREIVDAGPDVAFDPATWLGAREAPSASRPLAWRGRDESDPMWLARSDLARLRRRIWRGQLAVLFPWLETIRIDYLMEHGAIWIDEPEDVARLEFWPLILRMRERRGDRRHIAALGVLRHARNELAHGRSVAKANVDELVGAARALRRR